MILCPPDGNHVRRRSASDFPGATPRYYGSRHPYRVAVYIRMTDLDNDGEGVDSSRAVGRKGGKTQHQPPMRFRIPESRGWYLLYGLPIGFYFGLVAAFGVNVVFEDSWNSIVLLLGSVSRGQLTLAMLWAPHNENRMIFPYLLFLLTDLPSRYNATVDLYLSAALMTIAAVLLCWLVRRTTRLGPLWLTPIIILFLDPVQIENILWDFQLAWALIAALFVMCLCCIEASTSRRYLWPVAGLLATLASFSSLQGLLIWPAGLVYAWAKGCRWRLLVLWPLSGVAMVALYFWDFGNVEPKAWSGFPSHHLLIVARYFLLALGGWAPHFHTLAGAAVLAGLTICAVVAVLRPDWRSTLRVALALATFALMFVALIAWGRSALGPAEALDSRYTTYSIWAAIGIYIATAVYHHKTRESSRSLLAVHDRRLAPLVNGLVVSLVIVQLIWAVPHSISAGRAQRATLEKGAVALIHFRAESDAQLQVLFGPGGGFVRDWAPILQRHHWSVFS
jgi:hypothetical protein